MTDKRDDDDDDDDEPGEPADNHSAESIARRLRAGTLSIDGSVPLAPYAADELRAIDTTWALARNAGGPEPRPRLAFVRDDGRERWLVFLRPHRHDPAGLRVAFPAAWPTVPRSNQLGPLVSNKLRIVSRDGQMPPMDHWLACATLVDVDGRLVLTGVVDGEGRFVVAPRYAHIGKLESDVSNLTLAAVRGDGVLNAVPTYTCWAETREPDDAETDALGRTVCDLLDLSAGRYVNPPGTRMLAGSRRGDRFTIVQDVRGQAVPDARMAPMNLHSMQAPALCWGSVDVDEGSRWVSDFERLVRVTCPDTGLRGFVDSTGEVVVEPTFDAVGMLDRKGLCHVRVSGGWGAIRVVFDAPGVAGKGKHADGAGIAQPPAPHTRWRWLVEPRWRALAGDKQGHFTVQDDDGRWGLISPDGERVTPFRAFAAADEKTLEVIHHHCWQRFARTQSRAFADNLTAAARAGGSLALLAGSPCPLHDGVGDQPSPSPLAVRVTHEVQGTQRFIVRLSKDGLQEVDVTVPAGSDYWWPIDHINLIHLGAHAEVSTTQMGANPVRLPLDALALRIPAPGVASPCAPTLAKLLATWGNARVIDAGQQLLHSLDALADWLLDEPHPEGPGINAPTDLAESIDEMAGFVRAIAWAVAVQDRRELEEVADEDVRSRVDLPSLLTRQRYKPAAFAKRSKDHPWMPEQPPLWIGNEDEPGAIAPSHPWAVALAPLWQRVQGAYTPWAALLPKGRRS